MTTTPVTILTLEERASYRGHILWRFTASDGERYAVQDHELLRRLRHAKEFGLRVILDYYGGWYYHDVVNVRLADVMGPEKRPEWDRPQVSL